MYMVMIGHAYWEEAFDDASTMLGDGGWWHDSYVIVRTAPENDEFFSMRGAI